MAPWKASPISKRVQWTKITNLLYLRPQVKALLPPCVLGPAGAAPRSSPVSDYTPIHASHQPSCYPANLTCVLPFSPVDLVQIPQAEALLHADCSGKEMTCEISRYFLQVRQEATVEKAAWFITNVQISRGGPSVSMMMKILGDAENGDVWQPKLNLPQSPQGTVRAAGEKMKHKRHKGSFAFLKG